MKALSFYFFICFYLLCCPICIVALQWCKYFFKNPLEIKKHLWYTNLRWGCSSLGRALEWHSRGSRFDPDHLHHKSPVLTLVGAGFFHLYRKRGLSLEGESPLVFCRVTADGGAGEWSYPLRHPGPQRSRNSSA